jgi:hypothetical protein
MSNFICGWADNCHVEVRYIGFGIGSLVILLRTNQIMVDPTVAALRERGGGERQRRLGGEAVDHAVQCFGPPHARFKLEPRREDELRASPATPPVKLKQMVRSRFR